MSKKPEKETSSAGKAERGEEFKNWRNDYVFIDFIDKKRRR